MPIRLPDQSNVDNELKKIVFSILPKNGSFTITEESIIYDCYKGAVILEMSFTGECTLTATTLNYLSLLKNNDSWQRFKSKIKTYFNNKSLSYSN